MTSAQVFDDLTVTPDDFVCSVSQVSMFELCPRKWAWRYLDHIPYTTKFTERGSKVHGLLEKWFKAKVLPVGSTVEGKLAQAMLLHYPPPQSVDPNNVELEYTFQIAGISFWLAVDLYLPKDDDGIPVVCDHKTTSDLKWAMRPEDMTDDVQATLYAAWGMLKANSSKVRVKWVYAQHKNAPPPERVAISNWQPRTLPVEREMSGVDVRDRLGKTIETAKQIQGVRDSGCAAVDVPYDATACEQYGGCPYRDKCNLSSEERLEAVMSAPISRSDLLNKLKANKSNGVAAQSINPPEPPSVVEAPPVAAASTSLAERLRAKGVGTVAPEGPKLTLAEKLAAKKAAAASVAVQAPAETPEPSDAAETPKRGPGRPKGSKGKAAEPAEQQPWLSGALAPETIEALKNPWPGFASAAMTAILGQMDEVSVLTDADVPAQTAELAAAFADQLLAEYDKRFGK